MKKLLLSIVIIVIVVIGGLYIWNRILETKPPEPGAVLDEAKAAGRDAKSMPGADEDYYADMDYGVTKNPDAVRASLDPYVPGITADAAVKSAVRGRNNWIVWTAGNDRLWDELSRQSAGYL
ncbi:MAG TPA: hypothetical protein VNN25_24020, partial [Thermoanaerobaculia bacterium]|nr:hypothetical protein [Thermoanaerobaculia bacterium]